MRSRRAAVALAAAALAGPGSAGASAPTITYAVAGTAGQAGWYVSGVTVSWDVLGAATSEGCEAAVRLEQDTPGHALTCRASNADGTASVETRPIRIDRTPPTAAAAAARPPDAAGWYRGPVAVAWSGTDATSGLAGCTSLLYAGPAPEPTLTGTCSDVAGNVSVPASLALRYDATPPALTRVVVAPGDGVATVSWRAEPGQQVTLVRSPGRGRARSSVLYRGGDTGVLDTGLRPGVRYAYTVRAADAAGNVAARTARGRPVRRLLDPAPGARVPRPPLLRWRHVAGAGLYHVQLERHGRKVLSAWSRTPSVRLPAAWRHRGRRHRLVPGVYRWYLWAYRGRRPSALLGARTFRVA